MTRFDYLAHLDQGKEQAMATERVAERTEAPTAQAVDANLAAAFRAAIDDAIEYGPFLDRVADRLIDRLGLLPTAGEIAHAVREYDADHGVPPSADRTEGHPVSPVDGLS